MRIHARFGMIPDIRLIGKNQPTVFLQQIEFIRHRKRDRFLVFSGNLVFQFTVTLTELLDKLPYVLVDVVCNPLDDMKGIYYRNCVWKVFIDKGQVGIIHIRNQVSDGVSFFGGKINEKPFPLCINRINFLQTLKKF